MGEDIYDNWVDTMAEARRPHGTRPEWKGLWFGGVAFKYRTPIPNERIPELIARSDHIDVVTTTGHWTGTPADGAKVDAFIVATGIERRFGCLDPEKVRALADRIAAFKDA